MLSKHNIHQSNNQTKSMHYKYFCSPNSVQVHFPYSQDLILAVTESQINYMSFYQTPHSNKGYEHNWGHL